MSTAKLRYLHGLVESALRVSRNIDTFERNLESGYYNDEGKAAVAYQLDMFKPELLRRLRDIVSHAGELVDLEAPRCLTLSTAHVTKDTLSLLGLRAVSLAARGWPAMSIGGYKHGVFMTVPPFYGEEAYANLPSDLKDVFSFARANHCDLVRLDADGATVDDLPTYDWS